MFELLQVKEKIGGLRSGNHKSEAIRQCILAAQEESFRTCEVCGQPGHPGDCGRMVGSKLCATSMTPAGKRQTIMSELTHEQLWHLCERKPDDYEPSGKRNRLMVV